MKFEGGLWDAINRYVTACGGDPGQLTCGNVSRMQAVADVGAIIRGALSRQSIDDIVIEDLARGGAAAAKAACDRGTESDRLRDALRSVRFALRSTVEHSGDAIEMIDRVLDDKGEAR